MGIMRVSKNEEIGTLKGRDVILGLGVRKRMSI